LALQQLALFVEMAISTDMERKILDLKLINQRVLITLVKLQTAKLIHRLMLVRNATLDIFFSQL